MNVRIFRNKRRLMGMKGTWQYYGQEDLTVEMVNRANIDVVAHEAGNIRDHLMQRLHNDGQIPVGIVRITVAVGSEDD